MDFVDYGDEATFLHFRYTFRDIGGLLLLAIKRKDRTADKAAHALLPHWVSFFGAPVIILTD